MTKLFGAAPGEQALSGLRLLAHEQILVEAQARRSFPPSELEELAASIEGMRGQRAGIEGTGILQPLIVTPLREAVEGKRYKLVAGERRFRASAMLNMPHVPVIVISTPQDGLVAAQIVENLQRKDLPPLDEATAIQQLMGQQGLSIRETAEILGKPKSYLTDRLALLKMGDDVRELLSERSDTLLHGRTLDKVEDTALRAELIQAVRDGASLRDIQRRITEAETKRQKKARRAAKEAEQKPNIEIIREEIRQGTERARLLHARVRELADTQEKGLNKVRQELRLYMKRVEALEALLDGVQEKV